MKVLKQAQTVKSMIEKKEAAGSCIMVIIFVEGPQCGR
jgi:hypothetical protein